MSLSYLTEKNIRTFIKNALKEDIGDGDHSSIGSIAEDANSKAQLIIKGDGMIAGLELADRIFQFVDESLGVEFEKADGDMVEAGEIGFTVFGNSRSILASERLVLNCLQRMSAVATLYKFFDKPYQRDKSQTTRHKENNSTISIAREVGSGYWWRGEPPVWTIRYGHAEGQSH